MSFGIASAYGVPKGAVASIPGGKTISLDELREIEISFEDPHKFLGQPELLVKNSQGRHFGWPLKNNKTAAKCRQGAYRVVRPEELVDDNPFPIATQGGVGDGQVEWENHILVEIEAKYYKRHYQDSAWLSTLQLAKRAAAEQQEEAEKRGLPIKTHLTISPVTTA